MKGGKTRDGLRTRVMLSPCARAYADRICASVHLTGGGCTVSLHAAEGGRGDGRAIEGKRQQGLGVRVWDPKQKKKKPQVEDA